MSGQAFTNSEYNFHYTVFSLIELASGVGLLVLEEVSLHSLLVTFIFSEHSEGTMSTTGCSELEPFVAKRSFGKYLESVRFTSSSF